MRTHLEATDVPRQAPPNSGQRKARILIADDNAILRRFVHEALEDEGGWEVCGEAANGREALRMAADLKPDVVVLDVSMPEINGLEAAEKIHQQFPRTEIFIFTMYDAPELVHAAVASGARAYLRKDEISRLICHVRDALQNPPT